jgi:hypothetical protein
MWEPAGYPFEAQAMEQIRNIAKMPFIHKHVAVMPDAHAGKGSTVGTVIATKGAVVPAAVGVDIGCGMMAVRLTIKSSQLPDNLFAIRSAIEEAVPHGRSPKEDIRAGIDIGSWMRTRCPRKSTLASAPRSARASFATDSTRSSRSTRIWKRRRSVPAGTLARSARAITSSRSPRTRTAMSG